ncbi:MAG: extracellular matrix regulator RemB [Bacillota bacterium]
MYLHLGNEIIVRKSEIIAIIDLANTKSDANKDFIKIADIEDKIEKVSNKENMKSLVITDKKTYLLNISSTTLWKRANNSKFD